MNDNQNVFVVEEIEVDGQRFSISPPARGLISISPEDPNLTICEDPSLNNHSWSFDGKEKAKEAFLSDLRFTVKELVMCDESEIHPSALKVRDRFQKIS